LLIFSRAHLEIVLSEYAQHDNEARPEGCKHRIPLAGLEIAIARLTGHPTAEPKRLRVADVLR
jgi:hypothetical protein